MEVEDWEGTEPIHFVSPLPLDALIPFFFFFFAHQNPQLGRMRCCWQLLMTILGAPWPCQPCPLLGLTAASLEQPSALSCYDGDFHLFPVATGVL